MIHVNYDFDTCVRNSEKVHWRVDEILPEGAAFDRSRPFLPESLACTGEVDGLDADGRLLLNQLMGGAYLNLFGFVEEYIIAMAGQHAHAELFGDNSAMRALLRFCDEELKHQELFRRSFALVLEAIGPCDVLDNAVEVAGIILSKSPIAVLLTTLHIEVVTQHHFVETVRDDQDVDPLFASILKHHWLEEAQHAKIDTLLLKGMSASATPQQIDVAFVEYLEVCGALEGLLGMQAEMNAVSLDALDVHLDGPARTQLIEVTGRAYRRMFVAAAMAHPHFLAVTDGLAAIAGTDWGTRIRAYAAAI